LCKFKNLICFIQENGTLFHLLDLEGIDLLGKNVEKFFPGINQERYSEEGIHTSGHGLLGAATENKVKILITL